MDEKIFMNIHVSILGWFYYFQCLNIIFRHHGSLSGCLAKDSKFQLFYDDSKN